jgi:hypothetical protein
MMKYQGAVECVAASTVMSVNDNLLITRPPLFMGT